MKSLSRWEKILIVLGFMESSLEDLRLTKRVTRKMTPYGNLKKIIDVPTYWNKYILFMKEIKIEGNLQ